MHGEVRQGQSEHITSKREREELGEIPDDVYTKKAKYESCTAEDDKLQERRRRNKQAAERSRQKKKEELEKLQDENGQLNQEKTELEAMVNKLKQDLEDNLHENKRLRVSNDHLKRWIGKRASDLGLVKFCSKEDTPGGPEFSNEGPLTRGDPSLHTASDAEDGEGRPTTGASSPAPLAALSRSSPLTTDIRADVFCQQQVIGQAWDNSPAVDDSSKAGAVSPTTPVSGPASPAREGASLPLVAGASAAIPSEVLGQGKASQPATGNIQAEENGNAGTVCDLTVTRPAQPQQVMQLVESQPLLLAGSQPVLLLIGGQPVIGTSVAAPLGGLQVQSVLGQVVVEPQVQRGSFSGRVQEDRHRNVEGTREDLHRNVEGTREDLHRNVESTREDLHRNVDDSKAAASRAQDTIFAGKNTTSTTTPVLDTPVATAVESLLKLSDKTEDLDEKPLQAVPKRHGHGNPLLLSAVSPATTVTTAAGGHTSIGLPGNMMYQWDIPKLMQAGYVVTTRSAD